MHGPAYIFWANLTPFLLEDARAPGLPADAALAAVEAELDRLEAEMTPQQVGQYPIVTPVRGPLKMEPIYR
jgi:hypothetical protein